MIAFCFLLYDKVEHGFLWENFFAIMDKLGIEYSIYTHPKLISKETQPWVAKNSIKTIETAWGEYSLLKASLLMYKKALKNKKNEYFILLSGADIPMHNPKIILNQLQKDNKSHLDIRYNEEYDVWGASQWMYLSKQGANQLVRLLNNNDKDARNFLKKWIPETNPNGENCHVCEIYGADEAIPVNWFIYLYGNTNSKQFKMHIKDSCVTYAYFKTRYTQSPKIWTARSLTPYYLWEMKKCLFARKFDLSAIEKLNKGYTFSRNQINLFKLRKKKKCKVHWGQPRQ
jgi:hypothetical protein